MLPVTIAEHLPRLHKAIPSPTNISQRVQDYDKMKSFFSAVLEENTDRGDKRMWLCSNKSSSAHISHGNALFFPLMLQGADSLNPPDSRQTSCGSHCLLLKASNHEIFLWAVYSVLCTLLCTVKVYASLSLVMLKIIALITAGDADSSNLTANCRTLSLSCFMCFKKLFFSCLMRKTSL